jgi:hypothetical protein
MLLKVTIGIFGHEEAVIDKPVCKIEKLINEF